MSLPKIRPLLDAMAEAGASDLYIAADSPPMISVDGVLQPVGDEPLVPAATESLCQEVMSDSQFDAFRKHMEMNLAYRAGANRFRMNCYFQRGTMAMVARLIRSSHQSFDELNLPQTLGDLSMLERGIILVTGATGMGKSTTLAAMIDYRNTHSTGHIVTIEDPVEFVHEHKGCVVSQREVGIDTLSFEEALKSSLRQAPKVISIGEIRDEDTCHFALHASDTGHLVFATLHTNSANQTLERVINLFPNEQRPALQMQLSLNLRAIVCQRLVPSVGGGRVAAVEILINTARVQELILKGDIHELKTVMAKGASEGMRTFDQSLFELVKAGRVEEATAYQFADSANDLKLRLRGFGGSGLS